MFNGNGGAQALCCDNRIQPLPLPENTAIVSLGPISSCGAVAAQDKQARAIEMPELAATGRTILGREFPFPLVDAFGPAVDSGAPITGLTAFPRRHGLGRQYYGLEPPPGRQERQAAHPHPRPLSQREKGDQNGQPKTQEDIDSSFGQLPWSGDFSQWTSGGGGIDWNQVIANISTAVPQAIAATRQGSRYIYVNPQGQGQPGYYPQEPVGYNAQGQPIYGPGTAAGVGAAAGGAIGSVGSSLSAFIQQNPLLVLGGTLALVLLFMSPPRRR